MEGRGGMKDILKRKFVLEISMSLKRDFMIFKLIEGSRIEWLADSKKQNIGLLVFLKNNKFPYGTTTFSFDMKSNLPQWDIPFCK